MKQKDDPYIKFREARKMCFLKIRQASQTGVFRKCKNALFCL